MQATLFASIWCAYRSVVLARVSEPVRDRHQSSPRKHDDAQSAWIATCSRLTALPVLERFYVALMLSFSPQFEATDEATGAGLA
jgi:hypothetical protein